MFFGMFDLCRDQVWGGGGVALSVITKKSVFAQKPLKTLLHDPVRDSVNSELKGGALTHDVLKMCACMHVQGVSCDQECRVVELVPGLSCGTATLKSRWSIQ